MIVVSVVEPNLRCHDIFVIPYARLLINVVKLTFNGVSLWEVYGVYSSDHVLPTRTGTINGEQRPVRSLISTTSHYGLQVNPLGRRSNNLFWKTSLHGNTFCITGPLWEKSTSHWPHQRPKMQSFDFFYCWHKEAVEQNVNDLRRRDVPATHLYCKHHKTTSWYAVPI